MGTAIHAESDRIEPVSVPQRRLYTGATMLSIGLGTCGSDHVSASQVAEALKGLAAIGYGTSIRLQSAATNLPSECRLQRSLLTDLVYRIRGLH